MTEDRERWELGEGFVRKEKKKKPDRSAVFLDKNTPLFSLFLFVLAWSHLQNPTQFGLTNLNTSYSKAQIDNTTLRRLLDPKYIYKGLLR